MPGYVPPHLRRGAQGHPSSNADADAGRSSITIFEYEVVARGSETVVVPVLGPLATEVVPGDEFDEAEFFRPVRGNWEESCVVPAGEPSIEPVDMSAFTGNSLSAKRELTRTMHDSARTPGKLAFVFLFKGANPRWDTDHILFTKSNLDLLPQNKPGDHTTDDVEKLKDAVGGEDAPLATSGESEAAGEPIAVFKQVGYAQGGRSFAFDSWYRIGLIDYLEPKSPELIRMLEQKWTKTRNGRTYVQERSREQWESSLALRWAVVKFVKDEAWLEAHGEPAVERKPDPPKEDKKGVNEMLAEMRLKDVTNTQPGEGHSKLEEGEQTAKPKESSPEGADASPAKLPASDNG